MIRDIEDYLSDEQIRRCEKSFELGNDEYINSAYMFEGQLYIEIISDLYGVPCSTIYEPDLSDEEGQQKLNYILKGENYDR